MAAEPGYEEVEGWLRSYDWFTVEQIPRGQAEFKFRANTLDEHADVIKPPGTEYVLVDCYHHFTEEFLSDFLNRTDYERINFVSQIQSILASVPGKFVFLNHNDEICGLSGSLVKIRFERPIYPEGGVRQRLVDTIERFIFARKLVEFNEYVYLAELNPHQ
jgi:hypothetical protein